MSCLKSKKFENGLVSANAYSETDARENDVSLVRGFRMQSQSPAASDPWTSLPRTAQEDVRYVDLPRHMQVPSHKHDTNELTICVHRHCSGHACVRSPDAYARSQARRTWSKALVSRNEPTCHNTIAGGADSLNSHLLNPGGDSSHCTRSTLIRSPTLGPILWIDKSLNSRSDSGTNTDARKIRGRAEPNRGLRSGDERGVRGSELCASWMRISQSNTFTILPVSMNAVVHDTGRSAIDVCHLNARYAQSANVVQSTGMQHLLAPWSFCDVSRFNSPLQTHQELRKTSSPPVSVSEPITRPITSIPT